MNKIGTQKIETHRLILRPFRMEDAEDMYRNWASDPEVTCFLTWPPHANIEVTRRVIGNWLPMYADGGFFNWAIEWKETGRVIGGISVVRLNEDAEAAEIGYCLGRAFWGQGIMPEALRAVIDYLLDAAGLQRVAACHDANNPKSGRVMQKAGMQWEGVRRGAARNNQGIIDEVSYAILRNDRQPRSGQAAAAPAVRFAREDDLARVNELRKQVSLLHAAGKPEIFKPGFPDELRDYLDEIWNDTHKEIVVAELNGSICGYAILNRVARPETPFMFERRYLDIDEFGVDEGCRRQGVASAMLRFIRDHARETGFGRIELNMWEFNREALAFYEAAGFTAYRRYMEMPV